MYYKKIAKYLSWSRLKSHPAEYFLYVAVIMGMGFIVFTPPFQGWDESEHFLRTYQISEFSIYAEPVNAPNASGLMQGSTKGYGGVLPASLQEVSQKLRYNIRPDDRSYDYGVQSEMASVDLEPDRTKDIRFDNTTIYSPVPYLGGVIGIKIGKIFNQGPVVLLYLTRLFHLSIWIGLIYLSIRIIPVGKMAVMLIALSPVSVFIASTLSPDAIALGLLGVLLALVLKVRIEKISLDGRWLVFLGVILTALLLVKNIYLPVLLLLLLVPKKSLTSRVRAMLFFGPLIVFLAWNISVAHMTSTIPNYFNTLEHVNSKDQIFFIIQHPLAFVKLLAINIFGSASIALPSTYSGVIVDNIVPNWIVVGWTVLLAFALFVKEKSSRVVTRLSKATALVSAIVLAGITLLTILSLYVGWSPVASRVVYGVQGRYFIAASLLLIPIAIFSPIKVDPAEDTLKKVIYIALPLFLTAVIGVLAYRYIYGG